MSSIPEAIYKFVVREADTPIAFVSDDHRFVWVNSAWEDLLGYSQQELSEKTWMDVTVSEDVGGDMRSANELREVHTEKRKYSLTKRYIHKSGRKLSVAIDVYRFPPQEGSMFEMFAVTARADWKGEVLQLRSDNEKLHQRIEESSKVLSTVVESNSIRISQLEQLENMMKNENKSRNTITLNQSPAWIGGVVLALIAAAAYLAYISGWGLHGGDARPPHQQGNSVDLQGP